MEKELLTTKDFIKAFDGEIGKSAAFAIRCFDDMHSSFTSSLLKAKDMEDDMKRVCFIQCQYMITDLIHGIDSSIDRIESLINVLSMVAVLNAVDRKEARTIEHYGRELFMKYRDFIDDAALFLSYSNDSYGKITESADIREIESITENQKSMCSNFLKKHSKLG